MKELTGLELAIKLCKELHTKLLEINMHPALTGGTLYKEGERKDIDLVIYRSNFFGGVMQEIEIEKCMTVLQSVGCYNLRLLGRVVKGGYLGKDIDFIFPETDLGTYDEAQEDFRC